MALFTPQNIPRYNGNDLQGTVQQLLTAYKALTEQLTYVLQNIDDENGAASSGDVAELNDKMISAVSNAANAFSNASAALEAAQNAYQTAQQARNISEQAEATAEATKQDASAAQSAAASAQTAAETAKQSASAAQTAANTAAQKAAAAAASANTAAASVPKLSDSVSSSSSATAATSKAVKTVYDNRGTLLYRKIVSVSNIKFASAGYTKLTDMKTMGLSAENDYIVSMNIRGWSNGAGTLSLAKGSDGESIYAFCSQAATFTAATLEIWYAKYVNSNG